MKKGIYTASSIVEGSVMFRINGKPFTIRKGSPIDVDIEDKDNVVYSEAFMTLKFKGNGLKSESKPKNTKEEPKKEEPKKTTVKKTASRRTSSVKIETEEK